MYETDALSGQRGGGGGGTRQTDRQRQIETERGRQTGMLAETDRDRQRGQPEEKKTS